MLSTSVLAFVLAAAPSALATVFMTSPVASTSWQAGQQFTVSWQDDGTAPNLQSFGPSSIGLFAGSVQQQTLLQEIADNVDVSQVSSVPFTPQASVGPSGAYYFIRFTSNSLMDTANPQFPAQAFSAKFTLTGATGTFNATVQSEVDGATVSAGTPATSAAVTTSAASTPAASTSAPASSGVPKSSSHSSSAAATASKSATPNGAGRVAASGLVGVIGAAAVASLFL
ncbi:hypothetical protein FA95DRAFT_1559726 [Auriscalpium vulgare]|uniref:Uncharacterized protein n=1 Tax=Auriscalpium vulgare TaxID=40419 RepID=A0ACB8RRN2_9AGAM|nr:hypothetical protein FA95DRAFT_1559726 [Auriscalpium vulgare]